MLTVFISDLHLHPNNEEIDKRFRSFCAWAVDKVSTLYILGDFFHVWVGDDYVTHWSQSVAQLLKNLSKTVTIFFMAGNRDFLVGKHFAKCAGFTIVNEPHLIKLDQQEVMLAHGDRFCTLDTQHQRFRKITNNKLLRYFFLKLPLFLRIKIAKKVRRLSRMKPFDTLKMNVVGQEIVNCYLQTKVSVIIHGHTHKAGMTLYPSLTNNFCHYILSDWDDNPTILCYDRSKGFYFIHLE